MLEPQGGILVTQIPGEDPDRRLALYLVHDGQSKLILCQEDWAEGIGWYTQSRVEIDPSQVALLRQSLGRGQSAPKLRPLPEQHASTFRIVG